METQYHYAVITENDISEWEDKTGEMYHFPFRYLKYLQPGTKVIYYKGRIKDKRFENKRLSLDPHYFGTATMGDHYPDEQSNKNDFFATVNNFIKFVYPVPSRLNDSTIEEIPPSRIKNYWRDGVRPISEHVYNQILLYAGVQVEKYQDQLTDDFQGVSEPFTRYEGEKGERYTTTYERDPQLRKMAIEIHGSTCMACQFNFGEIYGEWGEGFIHVHHLKPISEAGEGMVNAKTDMIVLCPNCHAMVHRRNDKILSLEELRALIANQKK